MVCLGVPAGKEEEFNHWYNEERLQELLAVPGVLNPARGEPSYALVYEFEHEKVSESPEWLAQRNIDPDNPRMRDLMTHGAGSPKSARRSSRFGSGQI